MDAGAPADRIAGPSRLGFRRRPMVAAIGVTVAFVLWIIVGTALLDGLAQSETGAFVRDGIVRWPLAGAGLVALWWRAEDWPVRLTGLPHVTSFPWATLALAVGTVAIAVPVGWFWRESRYAAAVVFSEMATGVAEEVVFRAVIFAGLVRGLGRGRRAVRRAAGVSCVLFGCAHFDGGVFAVVVTALLAALFLASTLEVRSVWPAALFHGVLDVGVNGTATSPVTVPEGWVEAVRGSGDLVLLFGSLVAVVALWRWGRWPVDRPTGVAGKQ